MKKLCCMILLASLLVLSASAVACAEEERLITLKGDGADFRGSGITVNGSEITLTEPGEFVVTGTLNNGRIVINTGASQEKISLVLNGADLTCLDGAAIYVEQAEKVRLCMAEGTENTDFLACP